MVEQTMTLDLVFGCLSDPTRRDILKRAAKRELTVGEVARPYKMTLAAVSKHLRVLERARLIVKRRRGKEQMVGLAPRGFADAAAYLRWHEKVWEDRLDALEAYLKKAK
jgi:DNA-binding transcriptional ArsR family regulator